MPLHCNIDLHHLSDWSKPCGACNICQPTSALTYPFARDLLNSQMLVQKLKKYISESTGLTCRDTDIDSNPDILVYDKNERLIARVEAKYLEGKAFMKVAQKIGEPLYPKETLVVDEPKLISYFHCKERDRQQYARDIPIFVVWQFDRPCADVGGISIYQEVDLLKKIYDKKGMLRKYARRTGQGDYVNSVRLGVIDKVHYSITECEAIETLPGEILKLVNT